MQNKIRKIHFIGVGGSGMSGIAEVLLNQGFTIQGTDIEESIATQRLINQGAKIFTDHHADNVIGADVCVVSSAIKIDNPEIINAKKLKIPIVPRASMLGELMRFKQGVAVAGSHGKTTTTSMISSVLASAGFDPTYVLGGRLMGAETGARLGKGEYLVVEADESDGSFLDLTPVLGVITNIDNDHLVFYDNDIDKLRSAFISFVHKLPFYGTVFSSSGDDTVRALVPEFGRKTILVGEKEESDIQVINIKSESLRTKFSVRQNNYNDLEIILPMPGKHNVINSLFAVAVARELGVVDESIKKGLLKYKGVERRFQYHGVFLTNSGKEFKLIDDYGHHPTEIKVTLEACKEAFPNQKILLVFQPHRYSRTRDLFEEFIKVLSEVNALILLPVYAAGEDEIVGTDSKTLARSIRILKKVNPFVVSNEIEALDMIFSILDSGDILLLMGAGSVSELTNLIKNEVERGGYEQ